MAYVNINFQTKKRFKECVKAGEAVYVQPNAFGGDGTYAPGKASIEGPWYPQPHQWYADVDVDEHGKVLKVR